MTAPERPTAMVVNDDPSQLRLISAVLEKASIQTRCYPGVGEALASLHADPGVALIVTDLHMPGIDGWQFCQLLRSPQYPRFNRVPILVVSATVSGTDAAQLSLDLGADAFLAAPFAPSALQQYAAALLSGQRPDAAPRVLVVHRDAAEAGRLRAAFAGHGYVVEVAHSGADGLRVWRATQPDVAVIDDQLTDVSAERVLSAIQDSPSRTVACTVRSAGTAEGPRVPVDAARLIALCDSLRRQRSMLRVEEVLDERTRALRDSEARWRSLFEAIPEIVVVHDEAGVIRHINQTGAERLEWPAHELIGRNLAEFERRTRLGNGLRTEPADDASFESTYLSRGGREIPVEVNRRRMSFEGQAAVLSVARDISVRHELARQRQNFLAMLTHDIKNPLAIILGFAELLGEIGELNDEQRDLLARMQANATTVLTLVANYLNLTQIENGKLELHTKPTAVADIIESAVMQYRAQAQRQEITLTCAIEGSLGDIPTDAIALERVLTNLLHNALKFTPDVGRVSVTARRDDSGVWIEMRDSGIGIAPDELATIFQPYRRGTVRQPREGVGLGLFIAQSLVTAHGGRIEVASQLGMGTTFTVWLPASASDAAATRGA